jgi:hypothetical protein
MELGSMVENIAWFDFSDHGVIAPFWINTEYDSGFIRR